MNPNLLYSCPSVEGVVLIIAQGTSLPPYA